MIVVNPQAGLGLWAGAEPAAAHLRAAGWHVDIVQTEERGHGTRLACGAVSEGYQVVIGCGGDGTINEVVQGLVGSTAVLGIIPMGTANVLAREMNLPLDPVRAADCLLTGRVRLIDVGRAGDRAFVMMAGVGLDADVVRDIEGAPRRPPRLLKAPLLALATIRRLFTDRGTIMYLTIDGRVERRRVLMTVVGNIRGYAGLFQIADEADWDDGILDVVVFYGGGLKVKLGNALSVILRRHRRRPSVEYHRARLIHIGTNEPIPVQADGDLVGNTPMTFTIEPRALRILLPG